MKLPDQPTEGRRWTLDTSPLIVATGEAVQVHDASAARLDLDMFAKRV